MKIPTLLLLSEAETEVGKSAKRKVRINDGVIATYAYLKLWGRNDGVVWVNRDRLARERGISRSTAFEHIKILKNLGWIKNLGKEGKGIHTKYKFLVLDRPQVQSVQTDSSEAESEQSDTHSPARRTPSAQPVRPDGLPQSGVSDTEGETVEREFLRDEEDELEGCAATPSASCADLQTGSERTQETKAHTPRASGEQDDRESSRADLVGSSNVEPFEGESDQTDSPLPLEKPADVLRLLRAEVERRWGASAGRCLPPRLDGKEGGMAKHLLKKFGPELLRNMIGLVVWDWEEVRDCWPFHPHVEYPLVEHLALYSATLCGKTNTGFSRTGNRRGVPNTYRSIYLEGNAVMDDSDPF